MLTIRLRKVDGFVGVLLALFCLNIFMSIAMVRWGVGGLPVRTFMLVAILALIGSFATPAVFRAVKREWPVLLIIGYMTCLALIVSLVAGTDPAVIGRQLLEIQIQAAVGLIAGSALVRVCGPRPVGMLFIVIISVSVAVAVLQFLGLGIGWAIHDAFGRFQPTAEVELVLANIRERALGLAHSPVALGTQICLAFAVGLAMLVFRDGDYRIFRRIDWRVLALSGAFVVACLVCGNRSPLLGLILFFAIYLIFVKPALGLSIAAAALLVAPFADQVFALLSETGLRVLNTDNSSAQGRAVLQTYGLQLFVANPLGYGLAFTSTDYWIYHWDALNHMDNAKAISIHALHNYYLLILNKYGVLCLAVVPPVLWLMWRRRYVALRFVPYLVHIYYHNDGPLQSDFLIWTILPIFGMLPAHSSRLLQTSNNGFRPLGTLPRAGFQGAHA
jgi:hypothetical protein